MDSGQVNPAAAGLEIDRFDVWQLAPSSTSGYTPVPSSGHYTPTPSSCGYTPTPSSCGYTPVPSSSGYIPINTSGIGARRAVAPGIIGE